MENLEAENDRELDPQRCMNGSRSLSSSTAFTQTTHNTLMRSREMVWEVQFFESPGRSHFQGLTTFLSRIGSYFRCQL